MPTLDQPLFCEGFCPNCKAYYYYIRIDEPTPGQAFTSDVVKVSGTKEMHRTVVHKCGQKVIPTWRRLVVDDTPWLCQICGFTVFREKVAPVIDEATKQDVSRAATFCMVNGTLKRHMCEVPLKHGQPPYGQPLHPDDMPNGQK